MRSFLMLYLFVVGIAGFPKQAELEIPKVPKTHTYREEIHNEFPAKAELIQRLSEVKTEEKSPVLHAEPELRRSYRQQMHHKFPAKKFRAQRHSELEKKERFLVLQNQIDLKPKQVKEIENVPNKDIHDSNMVKPVAEIEEAGRNLAKEHLQEVLKNIDPLIGADESILEKYEVLNKAIVDEPKKIIEPKIYVGGFDDTVVDIMIDKEIENSSVDKIKNIKEMDKKDEIQDEENINSKDVRIENEMSNESEDNETNDYESDDDESDDDESDDDESDDDESNDDESDDDGSDDDESDDDESNNKESDDDDNDDDDKDE